MPLKYLTDRKNIALTWLFMGIVILVGPAFALVGPTAGVILIGLALVTLKVILLRKEQIRDIIRRETRRLERKAIEERFSRHSQSVRNETARVAVEDSLRRIRRAGIVETAEMKSALNRAIGLTS